MSDDADGSRAEPGRRGKVQSAEYGLLVLKTLGRAGGNLTLTALAERGAKFYQARQIAEEMK